MCSLFELRHLLSPILGPQSSWFSGLRVWVGMAPLAFLGLQFAWDNDGVPWPLWLCDPIPIEKAFVCICTYHTNSISLENSDWYRWNWPHELLPKAAVLVHTLEHHSNPRLLIFLWVVPIKVIGVIFLGTHLSWFESSFEKTIFLLLADTSKRGNWDCSVG